MELCDRIDEARQRRNILEHPFYTRWGAGELTKPELGFYAGEYRHAVVALAGAARAAGDPEHAAEEAEHVALWDDFAASLDAPLDRELRLIAHEHDAGERLQHDEARARRDAEREQSIGAAVVARTDVHDDAAIAGFQRRERHDLAIPEPFRRRFPVRTERQGNGGHSSMPHL